MSPPVRKPARVPVSFPIVGIGASAGGLEAFGTLLEFLPDNLGMAYVFVQHLSPNHESLLPQILERKTKMKVRTVTNNMSAQKNQVYVIPPNATLSIKAAVLALSTQQKGHRNFHPIDYFFSALAEEYKENAIGIVLSGTGNDGALGLKAIKAEGGISFVQDDSAKYSGMPQYAAEIGYADFTLSPAKIAAELAGIIQHPLAGPNSRNEFIARNTSELSLILRHLHTAKIVDFSWYKQTTIHRRIMRRMILNNLNTTAACVRMLNEDKKEVEDLYQDLLISVTSFFRDLSIEAGLLRQVLPALVKDRKQSDTLRIWIAGCATGEEAVTFAIIVLEFLSDRGLNFPVQIFATDLNEKAIERARLGLYPKSAMSNMSEQRLERFFVKADGHYQVVKLIRDMCVYAPHNLLKDPPFSRMDIVSCQNVLIYLEAVPQQKIMQVFHYSLKVDGFLVLGKSESIGASTNLFEAIDKKHKIFSRKAFNAPIQMDFSRKQIAGTINIDQPGKQAGAVRNDIDLDKETEKLLLSHYTPPCILVNRDMEILGFRGTVSEPFH